MGTSKSGSKSLATTAITGLGLFCSVHTAFAWAQVTGKPAIIDIGGETVILAAGTDGRLNMYEGWAGYETGPTGTQLRHFRDTTGISTFQRVDLGLPTGGHGISSISATPYYNSNGVVTGAWVFGSDSGTSNTLQGLVTIGAKNTNGTYTLPPTFAWKPIIAGVNTGYQGYIAQPASPIALSLPGTPNLAGTLDLFGLANESFGSGPYFPLVQASSDDSSPIPASPSWQNDGTGANAPGNYPDSYMSTPNGVSYMLNGQPYERVYETGLTQGLIYIASSSDRGQTWSWLRPTGVLAGSGKFGPSTVTTWNRLDNAQEIDCFAQNDNGNIYYISNLQGSSKYYYGNIGAPTVGGMTVEPTNLASASYADKTHGKQAVYVFGLANGLHNNYGTANHSDIVMSYWTDGSPFTWSSLYAPCWPMAANQTAYGSNGALLSTVNAPALLSTLRSDGYPRLVAAQIGNDGHMYTRTVDKDDFTDDPSEMRGSNSHKWVSAEDLYTVPGINLVITSITMSPPNPTFGQAVTFSATIKNIGSAPTPQFTPVGIQFAVDNPLGSATTSAVNWSKTYTTVVAPGESVTLTADGGNFPGGANTWSATHGTHYVRAWADDIHRFYEYDPKYGTAGDNPDADHQLLSATFTVP